MLTGFTTFCTSQLFQRSLIFLDDISSIKIYLGVVCTKGNRILKRNRTALNSIHTRNNINYSAIVSYSFRTSRLRTRNGKVKTNRRHIHVSRQQQLFVKLNLSHSFRLRAIHNTAVIINSKRRDSGDAGQHSGGNEGGRYAAKGFVQFHARFFLS